MRFKIFGFKGELATTGASKKKKSKDKDDEVVGVGFKAYSEFEPSTSRFQKPSAQPNGTAKTQNGTKPETARPKSNRAPPEPPQRNKAPIKPPVKKDAEQEKNVYQTVDKKKPPILKKAPENQSSVSAEKRKETVDENLEKSALISMTENKVDVRDDKGDQPIYDYIDPVKESSEGKKYVTLGGFDDVDDDSEDEFGAKKPTEKTVNGNDQNAQFARSYGYSNQAANVESVKENSEGKKYVTLGGFDDEDSDEFGAKKPTRKVAENTQTDEKSKAEFASSYGYGDQAVKENSEGKKYVTLGGFDDEDSDEFGAKKPTKITENTQTDKKSNSYGYSDQAASIFFRNDSPEPEQRVRNFSIKKGGRNSDDEDNTSQTSV